MFKKDTVILIDFFGVVSSEVAVVWFKKRFPEEEARRIQYEMYQPLDLGQSTEQEIYTKMSELTGESVEEIKSELYSLARINTEVVAWVRKARKHHQVILCSNASASFLRLVLKKNDIEDLFDEIFISSEIGITKPDKAYFEYVLDKLQVRSEQTIFFDDNPANVEAAENCGIQSYQFSSVQDLPVID